MDQLNSRKDAAGSSYGSSYVFNGAKAAIVPQTLTTGVTVNPNMSTPEFDTTGYYSSGAPDRFTVAADGKYVLAVYVEFAANATGVRRVIVNRNDGASALSETVPAIGNHPHSFAKAGQLDATAGQFFRIFLLQTSGGDLAINKGRFVIWKMP